MTRAQLETMADALLNPATAKRPRKLRSKNRWKCHRLTATMELVTPDGEVVASVFGWSGIWRLNVHGQLSGFRKDRGEAMRDARAFAEGRRKCWLTNPNTGIWSEARKPNRASATAP